jgi:hypothetical protein
MSCKASWNGEVIAGRVVRAYHDPFPSLRQKDPPSRPGREVWWPKWFINPQVKENYLKRWGKTAVNGTGI